MRTVESPEDSPEMPTAMVSTMKPSLSSAPVDSPVFAHLSPRRLSLAKKVRALDDAAYETVSKAEELNPKGGVFSEGSKPLWLLLAFVLFAFLSSSAMSTTPAVAAPATIISVAPPTITYYAVNTHPFIAATGDALRTQHSNKQRLSERLATMHNEALVTASVFKAAPASFAQAPLVLRKLHNRIATFVLQVLAVFEVETTKMFGGAVQFISTQIKTFADSVQDSINSLPISIDPL